MSRKAKYSKEFKLEIIKRYLNGESPSSLSNEYNLPNSYRNKIIDWAYRYEELGENGLNQVIKINHILKNSNLK